MQDVIATRFDDQIEPGDSIDLWTYDTENNLKGFPPQIWRAENATNIGKQAAVYLEKYPFKGRSDFSNVASDLALLVPQTKALLIVIITDGEEPFSGISLDLEINGFLAKKGKVGPAAAAKGPLLVSLSAIGGALRTWTAYFGDGRIDVATLPERTPSIAQKKSQSLPASKEPVKQQAVIRSPAIRQQPLIPAGETKQVFDFPAGTKFNSQDGASPLERPMELTAMVKAPVNSGSKTNAVSNAMQTNVASVTANAPATNLAKKVVTQTNVANVAAVAAIVTNTNAATLAARTNQITNMIAAVATPVSSNTAAIASVSSGGPPSPTVSSPTTLRQAMYVAAMTGVGCILAGVILIVRKLRRPTQSIISRSLLQR